MLSRQHSVLHIIDVQEKLFNVMNEREALRDNMVKMLKGIRVMDIPVIWIEQYPQGLGKTIPELSDIMEGMEPLEKMCFSSSRNQAFNEQLKKLGRNQVTIMGIETHVCVYQTVADLIRRGFDVRVVADACSSRTGQNHEYGIRAMENRGAKITTVEMALFELLGEAGTDEFRRISRIIK
jgi:nicotinamidase-related amidase